MRILGEATADDLFGRKGHKQRTCLLDANRRVQAVVKQREKLRKGHERHTYTSIEFLTLWQAAAQWGAV